MELIMNKIRKSLIAGSWYPGDKNILEKTIKKYIYSEDRPVLKREIKGLISPHAGYDYSGKVAAKAYGLLEGRQSLNVVILSPLHHSLPSKYVFNSATHYKTADIENVLIENMKNMNVIFIASSDLHHEYDYKKVIKKDQEVVEAISSFDINRIRSRFSQHDCSVCGMMPITIVLSVTKMLGARKVIVLSQTNSAEITGERECGQYVVGYVSAAIVE